MAEKREEADICVLLNDAISFLCKTKLTYGGEVSVEGVLRITLDNKRTILVNVNKHHARSDLAHSSKQVCDRPSRKRKRQSINSTDKSGKHQRQSHAPQYHSSSDENIKLMNDIATNKSSATGLGFITGAISLDVGDVCHLDVAEDKTYVGISKKLPCTSSSISAEQQSTQQDSVASIQLRRLGGFEQIPHRGKENIHESSDRPYTATRNDDDDDGDDDVPLPQLKTTQNTRDRGIKASDVDKNSLSCPSGDADGWACEVKGCRGFYSTEEKMRRHMVFRHQIKTYKCPVSGLFLQGSVEMQWHMEHSHPNFSIESEGCAEETCSLLDLPQPVVDGDKHQCQMCGHWLCNTDAKHSMESHMRVHASERLYCCTVCKASFVSPQLLIAHYQSHHHNRSLHICQHCGLRFSKKKKLTTHMAHHSVVGREHKCDKCTAAFTLLQCLRSHEEEAHGAYFTLPLESATSKRRNCKSCCQCGELFKRKKGVPTEHVCRRCKVTLYVCTLCKRCFLDPASLASHKEEHTINGKGQFICKQCHCRFTSNDKLQSHIRIHTGETPYKCNECEDTFAETSHLISHKLSVHDSTNGLVCPTCYQSFSNRACGAYSIHIRARKCKPPYKCDLCGWVFYRPVDLEQHVCIYIQNSPSVKHDICTDPTPSHSDGAPGALFSVGDTE